MTLQGDTRSGGDLVMGAEAACRGWPCDVDMSSTLCANYVQRFVLVEQRGLTVRVQATLSVLCRYALRLPSPLLETW